MRHFLTFRPTFADNLTKTAAFPLQFGTDETSGKPTPGLKPTPTLPKGGSAERWNANISAIVNPSLGEGQGWVFLEGLGWVLGLGRVLGSPWEGVLRRGTKTGILLALCRFEWVDASSAFNGTSKRTTVSSLCKRLQYIPDDVTANERPVRPASKQPRAVVRLMKRPERHTSK